LLTQINGIGRPEEIQQRIIDAMGASGVPAKDKPA
jgi:hypothetical protein